jgi:hypothetical protein
MHALTNAPAHLLILVSPERIGIETDCQIGDPTIVEVFSPGAPLVFVTRITHATGHTNDLLDFVSMLRNLGYTAVVLSDE